MNIGHNALLPVLKVANSTPQTAPDKVTHAADSTALRTSKVAEQKSAPGVQYHPHSIENEELIYNSDGNINELKPIILGTLKDSKKVQIAFEELGSTMSSGKYKFQKFKQNLQHIAPALATLKFGFTMDAKGGLVVTGVADAEKKERLEKIINQDAGLKKWAQSAFNGMTDYLKANGTSSQIGSYSLNKENFHKTIDLGKALGLEKTQSFMTDDFWLSQLAKKGTRLSSSERV